MLVAEWHQVVRVPGVRLACLRVPWVVVSDGGLVVFDVEREAFEWAACERRAGRVVSVEWLEKHEGPPHPGGRDGPSA